MSALKVEPVLFLLFLGTLIFAALLIFVEWKFNSDAQVFQVFAGVFTGFAGAFLGRMKPQPEHQEQTNSKTVSITEASTPTPPPSA